MFFEAGGGGCRYEMLVNGENLGLSSTIYLRNKFYDNDQFCYGSSILSITAQKCRLITYRGKHVQKEECNSILGRYLLDPCFVTVCFTQSSG